jgi:signal transduction histidine kinase
VSTRAALPILVDSRRYLERFAALLTHREPVGLASDALSALLADFGASAGSLFYAIRPPIRVRRGELDDTLKQHMDRWEANVEQRVTTGPWRLAQAQTPPPAVQPVEGTDQVALYSLIMDNREVVGTIILAYPQERAPGSSERALLSTFLQALGSAVGMVSELSLLKERLGQLSLFYQVAQSMASTFDMGKVLDDTMQLATAVLDASASALMLVDEKKQELAFEYAYGEMGSILRKQRTPLDEGIAGWVATHGVPVLVNNVREDPRFSPVVDTRTGFLTSSVVCAPIQIRGRTIGVLEALNKRNEQGFDAEDLRLMITTANQAAIAIENARLYQSLRDERDRILQAQEDVRRQVARNLHDGTVQFLSAISMGIDHLDRLLQFKPEAAQDELEALRKLTHQATQQARLALFELRPLILETQGLIPALETYVQQLQGSETFGLHLETPRSLPELDKSVATTIFSIVQEAVTNVKKHASARDVWLRLALDDGWLEVVIEDNGSGFDAQRVQQSYDRQGSIGMLNMKERAELIEGHLTIESNTEPPNSGTCITLRVPVQRAVAQWTRPSAGREPMAG